MPSVPFTTQRRVERFRDQRWLLDAAVQLLGPEFDQSRLQYYSAPMSPDHRGPVLGLRALIHRWDDLTREFARLARRYELQAEASLAQGHDVTAGDSFFAAAEHLNDVPGPKTLVVYAGEEHGMGGSRSSQLGSPFFSMIADWLSDRAEGKPVSSSYNVVDTLGQTHSEPWGERRSYQYGAPLGVDQLFAGTPPVGLA